MHWAYEYIGLEWEPYATGPDKYDCWGLVQHCLKSHLGVDVGRYEDVVTDDAAGITDAAADEIATGNWFRLDKPVEGAVVLMSKRTVFHHIGIYTDGAILHARDGADISLEPLSKLSRMGFQRIEFYIHKSLL